MSVDAGSSGTNPGGVVAKPAATTGWAEKMPTTNDEVASFLGKARSEIEEAVDDGLDGLEAARHLALAESEGEIIAAGGTV